jgi:hypothetical protein
MFSSDSICCLPQNFAYRIIMGQLWAVAWDYLFIKKYIAGVMQCSNRWINFGRMIEAWASIYLGLALPTDWLSIGQNGNKWVQVIASTIIDSNSNWLHNTLKLASMERQWSVNDFRCCILCNQTTDTLQTVIQQFLTAYIGKTDYSTLPAPAWKSASSEHQQLLSCI